VFKMRDLEHGDKQSFQMQDLQDEGSSADSVTADDFDFTETYAHEFKAKEPWSKQKVGLFFKNNAGIISFTILFATILIVCGLLIWDLTWKAWYALGVLLFTLVFLVKEIYPPEFVLVCGMALLVVATVITPQESLSGFSNTGVATIAVLFVVAKGIEESKVLNFVIKYVLRSPNSLVMAQLRLLIPVAVFSAFMNNTPIVAMMIPVVQSWGTRCGFPPSYMLMPLSYAAILGGTCTLIGTSTNLIVAALANAEGIPVGLFDISVIGVPVLICGLIYILIFSRILLPKNENPVDYIKNARKYTAAVEVKKNSIVVGKSIEEAGLRNLPGVYLFQINRKKEDGGHQVLAAPSSDTILVEGDILYFTGVVDMMREVYNIEGLEPATNQVKKIAGPRSKRCLVEAVISSQSPLVGLTVKQSRFRTKYNAAIVAVHRHGTQLHTKIGDIELHSGDVLLLEANRIFLKYHKNDSNFALVSELADHSVVPHTNVYRMIFTVGMAAVMVLVSTFSTYTMVGLFAAGLFVACLFIVTKMVSLKKAKEAISMDLLTIIAAAFALGIALDKTGAASSIAESLLNVFGVAGPLGVLFGLYLSVAFLSAVISNAAAVTLMFPVAADFASSSPGLEKAMVLVLMMAGSSSFATPIGYQTNIMVTGPGGYQFGDFLRFGLPLTGISMVVTCLLAYVLFAIVGFGAA